MQRTRLPWCLSWRIFLIWERINEIISNTIKSKSSAASDVYKRQVFKLFNEISFSCIFFCFEYCPKKLDIDNKSQHSDVEKKREWEREKERKIEYERIEVSKRERERERNWKKNNNQLYKNKKKERSWMPSFRFHYSKLWQSNIDNTHIHRKDLFLVFNRQNIHADKLMAFHVTVRLNADEDV